MKPKRVVISGVGFVTSIGNDSASVSQSLREGRTGIEPIDFLPGSRLQITVAGTIKGFSTEGTQWATWKWPDRYKITKDVLRGLPPHGLHAFCAMEQLIEDSKLTPKDLASDETGLFCASAGSPRSQREYINQIYATKGERVAPMAVVRSISGTLNFSLSAHYAIKGAVTGFSSACASTAHAIGYGFDEVMLGRQTRVLVVGGEDVSFDSLYPFHGMRALSRETDPLKASRPFDRDRDGFVGTGGAAALLLEDHESALARGAPIYAEVLGWGQASDGYNVASPDPEGKGLGTAMRRALAASGIGPLEVDYINAHATSTPAGDLAELRAIKTQFADLGAKPVVSSTKGLTGHGLSMASVMETGFCALAYRDGFTPGNPTLVNADPQASGLSLPRAALPQAPTITLKNSSGFGGSNVCLVLKRWSA